MEYFHVALTSHTAEHIHIVEACSVRVSTAFVSDDALNDILCQGFI